MPETPCHTVFCAHTICQHSLVTSDTSVYARGIQEAVGLSLADAVITNAEIDVSEPGLGGNYEQQNEILSHSGPALTGLVMNTYVSLPQRK